MKQYFFKDKGYDNLKDLLENYAVNYKEAIEDLYTNYKKFFKFVKNETKDKQKVEKVRFYLVNSKSKNSALTLTIFELLDEKVVYINGMAMSFEEFVKNLARVDTSKRNVFVDFLLDGGLEYTYSTLEEYAYLKDDAKYIDANADRKETITYLINYLNDKDIPFDELMSFVLTSNEKYRCFNRLVKYEEVLTYLSHKYGFNQVSKSLDPRSKAFEAAKVLAHSGNYNPDELYNIFNETPYIWFAKNYKNYKFKKNEAKSLKKRYLKLFKELKKLENKSLKKGLNTKLNKKKETTYFDLLMDKHKELLNEYLYLVDLYKDGYVTTKRDAYMLNMDYANTMVAEAYADGGSFTFAGFESHEGEYDLNDTTEDYALLDSASKIKYDNANIRKNKRIQRKNGSLVFFSIFFGILLAILTLGGSLFLLFAGNLDFMQNVNNNIYSHKYEFEELRYFITIGGGTFVLLLAMSIALSIRSKNTSNRLTNLLFIKECRENEKTLTVKQRQRFAIIEKDEKKLEKSLKDKHSPLASVVILLHGIEISLLVLFALYLLDIMNIDSVNNMLSNLKVTLDFSKINTNILVYLLSLFAGPVIEAVILFFKKPKNNWLLFLLDILTMVITLAVALFIPGILS